MSHASPTYDVIRLHYLHTATQPIVSRHSASHFIIYLPNMFDYATQTRTETQFWSVWGRGSGECLLRLLRIGRDDPSFATTPLLRGPEFCLPGDGRTSVSIS